MLTSSWYALHVLTGAERKVSAAVSRMGGLGAIAPQQILPELRGGDWKQIQRAVFPGYVFVKAILTPQIYYELCALDGVLRMLGGRDPNGQPMPIPANEMDMVLALANGGAPLAISSGTKNKGKISVKDGPLKLLEGFIVKTDARRKRATVEIPLFGENKRFDLGIEVETANSPTDAQADTSPRETAGDHSEASK